MLKQIVVLANSVKKDPGRCIAGREIIGSNTHLSIGPWIRPVNRGGKEGALLPVHFTFEDSSIPRVFDVIEIHLDKKDTDPSQPENWLVSEGRTWRRVDRWNIKQVARLLIESPDELWLQPGVETDRGSKEYFTSNPPQQSLYLLKLQNAEIRKRYWDGREKIRLCFEYKGKNYDLAITDPHITKILTIKNCLACISLAPPFRNNHYKIAAMVRSYD
ncbi:MAG: hypothetical protein HQK85_07415 [Nitrospinae bacterium]|nr:hypothetical protein [Nitrospinota bacterium]